MGRGNPMKSDRRPWKTILTASLVLSLAVLVESATAEEMAEYGDVEWGMSMKEVRSLVPGGTTEKNIVKGSTFYKSSRQFRGTEFEATYRFDDGKLVSVDLYKRKIGAGDVEGIQKQMTEKYGPSDEEKMGSQVWYTDDGKLTLIPLNAAGEKSYPVMIRYRKPQPED
jgi:hypothetical protein